MSTNAIDRQTYVSMNKWMNSENYIPLDIQLCWDYNH